ncbi:MAG: hypothetical protein GYA55_14110 [SAR324 cluster bacterium]|uniref:Uncharacterized protein n=1 Tax=SAR324 cluster bacterium TaxID=2024889 RepID=A0A7X9FU20_9DELT|nr:hypothetical protein [SAR324 cluster bacterium]
MKNLILLTILIFLLPFNAHAYLDPGSGSMILQLIVAGVAGLFVGLKFFWGRIVAFFKGSKPDDRNKE